MAVADNNGDHVVPDTEDVRKWCYMRQAKVVEGECLKDLTPHMKQVWKPEIDKIQQGPDEPGPCCPCKWGTRIC
jgi:hypothetical protein